MMMYRQTARYFMPESRASSGDLCKWLAGMGPDRLKIMPKLRHTASAKI
jgi:hypothetical protein